MKKARILEEDGFVFWSLVNSNRTYGFVGESPGGSAVKNPSAIQETWKMQVRSLGQDDPLQEGMAPHSSILVWRIPWTEEPGGLLAMGLAKSQTQLKRLHSTVRAVL